jgi:hypothetical protein
MLIEKIIGNMIRPLSKSQGSHEIRNLEVIRTPDRYCPKPTIQWIEEAQEKTNRCFSWVPKKPSILETFEKKVLT